MCNSAFVHSAALYSTPFYWPNLPQLAACDVIPLNFTDEQHTQLAAGYVAFTATIILHSVFTSQVDEFVSFSNNWKYNKSQHKII